MKKKLRRKRCVFLINQFPDLKKKASKRRDAMTINSAYLGCTYAFLLPRNPFSPSPHNRVAIKTTISKLMALDPFEGLNERDKQQSIRKAGSKWKKSCNKETHSIKKPSSSERGAASAISN